MSRQKLVLDTQQSFEEIIGTQEALLQQIFEIRKHATLDRSVIYNSARNLRFITAPVDSVPRAELDLLFDRVTTTTAGDTESSARYDYEQKRIFHECLRSSDFYLHKQELLPMPELNNSESTTHGMKFQNISPDLARVYYEEDARLINQRITLSYRERCGPFTTDFLAHDDLQPIESCRCRRLASFPRNEKSHSIYISKPGEIMNCSHYVAVSYRWQKGNQQKSTYTVLSKEFVRNHNEAPDIILDRAIKYAAYCGVPLIWIDQECIRQKVPGEQESGIQSMDIVYQEAISSVGLLNFYIQSQQEMDCLDQLLRGDDFKSIEQFDCALGVLEKFAADEWVTRAWIYQECAAAGHRMTFLIQCDIKLKRAFRWRKCQPHTSLMIPGEYDLTPQELLESLIYIQHWPRITKTSIPYTTEKRVQKLVEILWDIPTGHSAPNQSAWPLLFMHDRTYRPPKTSINALGALGFRHCSRIADRIAIQGNLCDYQIRINTEKAESEESIKKSLSICLYTLALLNGDISLVTMLHQAENPSTTFSWFPPMGIGLEDFVIDSDVVNVLAKGKPFRLLNPVISENGILTVGYLWKVDTKIDMSPIQQWLWEKFTPDVLEKLRLDLDEYVHVSKQQKMESRRAALVLRKSPELRAFFQLLSTELVWKMMNYLLELGHSHLADALWYSFHVYSSRKVADPESFSKSLVIDRDNNEKFLSSTQIIESVWINVLDEKGYLLAGRSVSHPSAEADKLTCIFDIETPGYVFTPFSETLECSGEMRLEFVSWAVERTSKCDQQIEVLICKKMVKGSWKNALSIPPSKEFCLSWNLSRDMPEEDIRPSPAVALREEIPPLKSFLAKHVILRFIVRLFVGLLILVLLALDHAVNRGFQYISKTSHIIFKEKEKSSMSSEPARIEVQSDSGVERMSMLATSGNELRYDFCCIVCSRKIIMESTYFHCQKNCNNNNFDMCQGCNETGKTCTIATDMFHQMEKRLVLYPDMFINVEGLSEEDILTAAIYGRTDVIRFLLEGKSVIRSKGELDGKTALHWASEKGWDDIVMLLVQSGMGVADQDHKGKTPLHYASENGHADIVEFLLQSEADSVLSLEDKDGCNPLQCAQKTPYFWVLPLLKVK